MGSQGRRANNANSEATCSTRSKTTSTHRINKARRLRFGSICIPLNDAQGYRLPLRTQLVYPILPSDQQQMNFVIQQGLLNKIVFGLWGNKVIEGLTLDEKSGIP